VKLVVSNLAWAAHEEPEIAQLLQKLGIKHIEIAPTKVWDEPLKITDKQIKDYLDFWAKHGIKLVAFQAMMFPRPDLKLFESAENRAETLEYLKGFIRLAGKMGVGVMVFGSPKNRQRGKMPEAEAQKIAKQFFTELGDEAQKHNVHFLIEPNAPQYACDFVTVAKEGVDIVKAVGNPGFGLHLDIGCMTMAGEDPGAAITAAGPLIQHFHISSPMLEAVEDREDVHHQLAGDTLRQIGYDNFVSIEMRPGEEGTNAARVKTAIELARKYYA
jgi:sugar phosphate isomerase/epimerase